MSHAFDEEFEHPAVDAVQVGRRVADWQRRVDDLMNQMKTWCQVAGLSVGHSEPVLMNEELMRKFGVPAIELPTLYIDRQGEFLAKIIPFGLWIIGGNGRVDLKTNRGVYKIIDTAGQFEAANWRLAGPTLRDAPMLDESTFKAALDI